MMAYRRVMALHVGTVERLEVVFSEPVAAALQAEVER
jgi:hypothetical protein